MRILPALIIATLVGAPATAATRDWPARGFDKVDLRSAANVSIVAGPSFSVHADGDPRLLQRMTADVHGGTLVLGWQKGEPVHVENNDIRVTVTMPRVAGIAISGAGAVTVDKAVAPDFSADVSGAGTVRVGMLRSNHTTLAMGGAGEIVVAGRTDRLDARVSGVGSLDASRLAATGGTVSMSGTGHALARVDGPVDVTLSGLGSVEILGHPRCSIHKSGLGSVRCG